MHELELVPAEDDAGFPPHVTDPSAHAPQTGDADGETDGLDDGETVGLDDVGDDVGDELEHVLATVRSNVSYPVYGPLLATPLVYLKSQQYWFDALYEKQRHATPVHASLSHSCAHEARSATLVLMLGFPGSLLDVPHKTSVPMFVYGKAELIVGGAVGADVNGEADGDEDGATEGEAEPLLLNAAVQPSPMRSSGVSAVDCQGATPLASFADCSLNSI